MPVATFSRSLAASIAHKENKLSMDEGALTACRIDGKPDQTRLKISKIVQFETAIDSAGADALYLLSEPEFVDATAELACCE